MNFLIDLARHPSFKSADVHTGFIPQHFDTLFPPLNVSDTVLCQAGLAVVLNELKFNRNAAIRSGRAGEPFVAVSGFRMNHAAVRKVNLSFNGKGKLVKEVPLTSNPPPPPPPQLVNRV